MNQEAQQESLAGGGNNTTTGFASGTICTASGTFRSSTRYMDVVCTVGKDEPFPLGSDGKKTTWVRLTTSLSSNKGGSFESVKVLPGTV